MGETLNYFYVVDGKAHGKNILYLADTERRFFHREWHKGRQFGVFKSFTKEGKNTGEVIFTRRRMWMMLSKIEGIHF